jgi:hypothetical protein
MLVTMRTQISGTRDGERWPPPGETIEVPDPEGFDLIRADLAEQAERAAPGQLPGRPPVSAEAAEHSEAAQSEAEAAAAHAEVASQEAAEAAEAARAPAGDGADTGQGEPSETAAAEPDVAAAETPAAAPGPSAPKQAWIDYAVNVQGADVHAASSMTKADLMSRYGGRL